MFKGGFTTGSIIRPTKFNRQQKSRQVKPRSNQRREWRSNRRYPEFLLTEQPSPDLYKNHWQIEDEQLADVSSNASASTKVSRNRIEEDKPKRNFGDYDPVHNKTAPRSDRCRIVRRPKLENRQILYKGISDNLIKERWNSHKNTVFENADYATSYPIARSEINPSTQFPDTIKLESTRTTYDDHDDDDDHDKSADLSYNKLYKNEFPLPHIKTEQGTESPRKKSRWDVPPSSSNTSTTTPATCGPSSSSKTSPQFQSTTQANSNQICRVPSNQFPRHYYEDTMVNEEDASDPAKVARIQFDPNRRQPEAVKIFRNRYDDLM